MTSLVGLIEAVHASFDRVGLPHAFGGALALAYAVWEPRATADIDINVFISHVEARRAFDALPQEVDWTEEHVARVERDGQVRCRAGHTPIDLFLNTTDFHVQASRNVRTVPFGEVTIPVLAPNDLAVFKAFFDRPKDWVDLQAMADAGSFDADVVTRWLTELLGDDDPRIAKVATVIAARTEVRPDGDPIMNLSAATLGAPAPCGHPTRRGPCRNLVSPKRRCAAGHPPRPGLAPE